MGVGEGGRGGKGWEGGPCVRGAFVRLLLLLYLMTIKEDYGGEEGEEGRRGGREMTSERRSEGEREDDE